MYQNKINNKAEIPLDFDEDVRDLLKGLLVTDPEQRLGSKLGIVEIKNHKFFKGINW